jgi:hypothetical protein
MSIVRPWVHHREAFDVERHSQGRRIAWTPSKEGSMHARLIEFSGADAGKREQMEQTIKERVLPMLRTYDGFAGYLALYDEDGNRAKAIILWETEENAVAAEETLAERRRQITGGLGLTIESEDLYEAAVVEFESARIAN